MRILVVNNMAPFIRGGAEALADHLVANINSVRGVSAELLRVPFTWMPFDRIAEEILICRTLELVRVDRVIGLKFPAYLIPHNNKVLWILHQYRQAYDLYGTEHSHIPCDADGDICRRLVEKSDNECFSAVRGIYVNSAVTQERLQRYNGFTSLVLHPPLNDPHLFNDCGGSSYIFAGGRVNAGKRQHVLVEALRHCKTNVRLIIGGRPDTKGDADRLSSEIRKHGVEDRVELDLRFLEREQLAAYINNSIGCAYCPFDEDSFGYFTMEAFHAKKPIITLSDSGGLLEIVLNGQTGRVADPEPKQIAAVMDDLFAKPATSRAMGCAGYDLLLSKGLSWPNTLEKLLS